MSRRMDKKEIKCLTMPELSITESDNLYGHTYTIKDFYGNANNNYKLESGHIRIYKPEDEDFPKRFVTEDMFHKDYLFQWRGTLRGFYSDGGIHEREVKVIVNNARLFSALRKEVKDFPNAVGETIWEMKFIFYYKDLMYDINVNSEEFFKLEGIVNRWSDDHRVTTIDAEVVSVS